MVEQLFIFEMSPNTTSYVGPAFMEWIYGPVGLLLARFSGRMPISRPKIENFTGTKFKGIAILHMHDKFQASRFNNNFFKKSSSRIL